MVMSKDINSIVSDMIVIIKTAAQIIREVIHLVSKFGIWWLQALTALGDLTTIAVSLGLTAQDAEDALVKACEEIGCPLGITEEVRWEAFWNLFEKSKEDSSANRY